MKVCHLAVGTKLKDLTLELEFGLPATGARLKMVAAIFHALHLPEWRKVALLRGKQRRGTRKRQH